MLRARVLVDLVLFAAATSLVQGCGNSTSPAPVPVPCTLTVTMTFRTPSPSENAPFASYFAATVVPNQAVVDFVNVNALPSGCFTPWTAVSADTSAVQLSPAAGQGRGQVELFMPTNTGSARSTQVTIAGQTVTVNQAGR